MTFVLRRAVAVSPDADREDAVAGRTYQIPAGTNLDDIFDSEMHQLSPAHFVEYDADGNPTDAVPDEWRTNKDTLAHDRRQDKNQQTEAKERAKRKAAKNAAAKAGEN